MNVQIVINLELTENEIDIMKKDCEAYINKHLLVIGTVSNYYDIYSTHFNDITIKECKFPNDLEKSFFRNNIFFLCELQKYKYNELYDWLKNNFDNNVKCKEYLELVVELMQINHLSLSADGFDKLYAIQDTGLSPRAVNCLTRAGIVYLQDIALHTQEELERIRNLGVKTKKEIEEIMQVYGIKYRNDLK